MKRILVTGANGFLGKNLCLKLNENPVFKLLKFTRNNDFEELKDLISKSDYIVHFASLIKSNNEDDFKKTNIFLTKKICKITTEIKKKNKKIIPIYFSSTYKVNDQSIYGRTKYEEEKILKDHVDVNKGIVFNFRLPGIFGKFAKPNYNNVVATFCHNISRNKEIQINSPDKILEMVYVDDVVNTIISLFDSVSIGWNLIMIKPVYKIKLKDLANKIKSFHASFENQILEGVGFGLERALYATYISNLPLESFSIKLKKFNDHRGDFLEAFKTKSSGQVSFFTINIGFTRGGHYHHTKSEKFLVVKGKVKFKFINILNNQEEIIYTDDSKPVMIHTIPGWAHDITNVGDSEVIVMLWANEIFDKDNPDTFQYEMNK